MYANDKIKNVLTDFAKGIRVIFGDKLKDVIIFGSYARGDYDMESDIDIAILADIPREEERNYINDIVTLLASVDRKHHYSALLSPIILSSNFFDEWKDTIPFYASVRNEGVSINA